MGPVRLGCLPTNAEDREDREGPSLGPGSPFPPQGALCLPAVLAGLSELLRVRAARGWVQLLGWAAEVCLLQQLFFL